MNTIGVYTLTTTPAGYKADLVKAFAKGMNVKQLYQVLLKSLPQVKVMLIKKRCMNNLNLLKVLI